MKSCQPTEEENKLIYLFCTNSKQLAETKKSYKQKKEPLNKELKSIRNEMLEEMQKENKKCFQVGDMFLRVQNCSSRSKLTDEMISECVFNRENLNKTKEETINCVVNLIDKIRNKSKMYAKVMKTPPKDEKEICKEVNELLINKVNKYNSINEKLCILRDSEKLATRPLQEQVVSLSPGIKTYMDRVGLVSQRINLGNKNVKEVSQTYFLRKKEKIHKKTITKKLLKEIISDVLEKYFVNFEASRDLIVQEIAATIKRQEEKVEILSFDKGHLKLK